MMHLTFPLSFRRLTHAVCRWGWISGLLVLGSMGLVPPAIAAEEVVLTYGGLQVAFPVADFRTLAETGAPPPAIAFYLGIAGVDPAAARNTLLSPVPLSPSFLNRLGTAEGDRLLLRLVDVVHTASGEGSVPALRSAILQAASADQQITLLELMEYYPNSQMFINGANISDLLEDLSDIQRLADIE